MSTPSSKAEINEMNQGFYFIDRDMTKIRREFNIEEALKMRLFFSKSRKVPPVISFKHNQGENGDQCICVYQYPGEDEQTTIFQYNSKDLASPVLLIQQIANNNLKVKEKVNLIKKTKPDFIKILDIIPHLTRAQLDFFRTLFDDKDAKIIMDFVTLSNNYKDPKLASNKTTYENELEKMLLNPNALAILEKAVEQYEKNFQVLNKILKDTASLVDKPKQSTSGKPATHLFTQTKKEDGFAKKQMDYTLHLTTLFNKTQNRIGQLENKLSIEKKKSILKRSETQIKLFERQLINSKNHEKALASLIPKVRDLADNTPNRLKKLEALMEPSDQNKQVFIDKQFKILATIDTLTRQTAQYIVDHPDNKTTSGWVVKADTKRKLQDASDRYDDLLKLTKAIGELKPWNIGDSIALDYNIEAFETKLQVYRINNSAASGLRGSAGKVNDMLKEAETGLKELYNIKPVPPKPNLGPP